MRLLQLMAGLVAVTLGLPAPSLAQQIQLIQVASGLSSPVFVTNAGDNLNRLFIVERAGIVKVRQSSTTSVFLDIRTRVESGGNEQGLLGLAFHPQVQR